MIHGTRESIESSTTLMNTKYRSHHGIMQHANFTPHLLDVRRRRRDTNYEIWSGKKKKGNMYPMPHV